MDNISSVSIEKADIHNARRFYLTRLAAALGGLLISACYSLLPNDVIPSHLLLLFGPLLIIFMLPLVLSAERLVMLLLFTSKIKSRRLFPLIWSSHSLIISSAAFFALGNNNYIPEDTAKLVAGITGLPYFIFFAVICLIAMLRPQHAAAAHKFVTQVTKAKRRK